MNPATFFVIAVLAIILAVNGYAAYLWNRLNTLIHQTGAHEQAVVGDHVARLYTVYLYNQIMSAGSFSIGPKMVAIGNPERDRVVRAVKGSDEYVRIQELASYIRGLPINFVPYFM